MTPRSFLRASLAAPLLVPIVANMADATSGVAFLLVMSLVFGGVPYGVTALILWWLLGRCQSVRGLVKIALLAPVLFATLQAATWLLWSMYKYEVYPSPNGPLSSSLSASLALAGYGLAFGYAYVLLVLGAFFVAIHLKFVALPQSTTLASGGNAA